MAIAVTRASVRRALRSSAAVVTVLAALAQPAAAAYTSPQVRAVEAVEATSLRPIRLAVVGGMPRSVSLELPVAGTTPASRARAFLSAYAPLFHLDRPGMAVTPARVLRPVEGVAVVRHSQTWGGIPVYGAHLDVFLAADAAGEARVVYAAASLLNPVIVDADPPVLLALDTTPRLMGTDAELIAYAVAGCASADGPEPRLEIVDPAVLGLEGAPRLAWHVARPRCAGNEALVDALTGDVLFRNTFVREDGYWKDQMDLDLEDANGGTINSTGCFNPTTMDDWIGDVDGILPDYLGDADAVVAWHGARDTYRTWHDLWGWHSFDGDNSELEVYVHAGVEHNAHGLANCGIEIGDGFSGIDVVAHEFGHMVIQVHSGYYMWNQAGALHEGLSDAAAMVVDPHDWTMSEDVTDGTGPGRALDHPELFTCGWYGPCPDRMSKYISTSLDNGGIHWNAGIIGKAFYLLADGGSFNGWTVEPLGRNRMGYIASLVMRVISDTDRFVDARNIALAFASPPLDTLFGLGARDACAIRNAFRAVEIGFGDRDCDGVEEESIDTDGDGVPDYLDNCVFVKNPDQADMEGDGIGDRCDLDGDNDGYPDSMDTCWGIPNDFRDPDHDGIPNCMDQDADGDGVLEDGDGSGNAGDHPCASGQTRGCDDSCPGDRNPDQYDGNANGFGDACDPDFDGDGIYDEDNCPFVASADQADSDGDGLGDACDACPSDADGAYAWYQPPCIQPPDGGTAECPPPRPLQHDADGDGIPDACDTMARRKTGFRIDGALASRLRFLSPSDSGRELRVTTSGEGIAYAMIRLCGSQAGALGDCILGSEQQLELVLSGLDPGVAAWVEDASGIPVARAVPSSTGSVIGIPLAQAPLSSTGDGTLGLRFRAAADTDYQLALAPAPGFIGELVVTASVRVVPAASTSPWRRPPIQGATAPPLPPDTDDDGLWDSIDLCPATFDPTNRDGDRDRVGNACDACPATAPGARVDAAGCSIADRCPCAPLDTAADPWRNHGAYVSCVAGVADRFLVLGLISAEQKDAVVAAAAGSACGHR